MLNYSLKMHCRTGTNAPEHGQRFSGGRSSLEQVDLAEMIHKPGHKRWLNSFVHGVSWKRCMVILGRPPTSWSFFLNPVARVAPEPFSVQLGAKRRESAFLLAPTVRFKYFQPLVESWAESCPHGPQIEMCTRQSCSFPFPFFRELNKSISDARKRKSISEGN
jgi:hypothetical protein